MNNPLLLLLPIALPILSGLLVLPLLRGNSVGRAWVSLATVLVVFLGISGLLLSPGAHVSWNWAGDFQFSFGITSWKALLLLALCLFQIMNGIYLLRYIPRIPRPYLFLLFSLVAFASACGVILTDNVLILLIGWELFLVALYALILSGGDSTERVAMKALLLGGASDFLMILGLMLYIHLGGSANLAAPQALAIEGSWPALASFVLIFLGAGAKAGMYPFHTWIPEAAEAMPAPGFAALPASMEKILGIYFLFLVTKDLFVLNHAARTVMYLFAAATIYAAVIPAFVEKNFKRVLALTAISPVGFMVAGLATSTAAGMAGALLYMLTHATYKSTMFYAVSNLETCAGGSTLEAIEHRPQFLRWSVLGFFLALTAALSLPPTSGFIAKEFIFEGLLEHGSYWAFAAVWLGAILNIAVMLKLAAVLLSHRKGVPCNEKVGTPVLPVLFLGLLALAGGFLLDKASCILGGLVGFEEHGWLREVWHITPITIASLGVYVLGTALFFAMRDPSASESDTFSSLRTSPVLGRAYELAEAKTFDAYEVGLRVIHWLAKVVFRGYERLIDVVADWVIDAGGNISRRALSGAHNGIYSNYLAWVLAGFVLVAALFLLR